MPAPHAVIFPVLITIPLEGSFPIEEMERTQKAQILNSLINDFILKFRIGEASNV